MKRQNMRMTSGILNLLHGSGGTELTDKSTFGRLGVGGDTSSLNNDNRTMQINDEIFTRYDAPQPKLSRKRKGIRPKGGNVELVVGKSIHLEQIPEYLKVALARSLCGKVIGRNTLERWMKEN